MTCLPHSRRPAVLMRDLYPKPNFLQLLAAVTETCVPGAARWREASTASRASCGPMASGLRAVVRRCSPHLCDHAVGAVLQDEDVERGGFGRAPKFPRRRSWKRCCAATSAPRHPACGGVERTCRRWRWSIYDQLAAGSPATASTASWVVPHSRRCSRQCAVASGVCALGPSPLQPVGPQGV